MRDAGKPTPMTPPESSHTASRHTTGDPPLGGKSASHIGSDWSELPVEQDYPASAWDTSTDYRPRKTWLDVREEVLLAIQRERIK